jgi:hypothetical protein
MISRVAEAPNGQLYPIEVLYDKDGKPTPEPQEAVSAVIKLPDGQYEGVQVNDEVRIITIH